MNQLTSNPVLEGAAQELLVIWRQENNVALKDIEATATSMYMVTASSTTTYSEWQNELGSRIRFAHPELEWEMVRQLYHTRVVNTLGCWGISADHFGAVDKMDCIAEQAVEDGSGDFDICIQQFKDLTGGTGPTGLEQYMIQLLIVEKQEERSRKQYKQLGNI